MKAFAEGTLDVYEGAYQKDVGLIPETRPMVTDAKVEKLTPKS